MLFERLPRPLFNTYNIHKALIFIVERIFERAFQALAGNLLNQVFIGRQMVGQQIRQEHRRGYVRREVLQGVNQRREFLLHPHVDIDRRILFDFPGLEESSVIVILRALLGLFAPTDDAIRRSSRGIRRDRFMLRGLSGLFGIYKLANILFCGGICGRRYFVFRHNYLF